MRRTAGFFAAAFFARAETDVFLRAVLAVFLAAVFFTVDFFERDVDVLAISLLLVAFLCLKEKTTSNPDRKDVETK